MSCVQHAPGMCCVQLINFMISYDLYMPVYHHADHRTPIKYRSLKQLFSYAFRNGRNARQSNIYHTKQQMIFSQKGHNRMSYEKNFDICKSESWNWWTVLMTQYNFTLLAECYRMLQKSINWLISLEYFYIHDLLLSMFKRLCPQSSWELSLFSHRLDMLYDLSLLCLFV